MLNLVRRPRTRSHLTVRGQELWKTRPPVRARISTAESGTSSPDNRPKTCPLAFCSRVAPRIFYTRDVSSERDDQKKILVKLKTASQVLDSARRASRAAIKEANRANRAVAEANKKMARFEYPKIRSRRKHR